MYWKEVSINSMRLENQERASELLTLFQPIQNNLENLDNLSAG